MEGPVHGARRCHCGAAVVAGAVGAHQSGQSQQVFDNARTPSNALLTGNMNDSTQTSLPIRMSYWLIPEASFRASLQQVIDELADSYRGPTFVPHMTVSVSAHSSLQAVDSLLRQAAKMIAPLMLNPVELLFSPQYTKSCFLQFDLNADLIQLSDCFRLGEASEAPYAFNPHMSLFYGALGEQQRRSIQGRIQLPKEIYFTELWANQVFKHTETAQDVHRWKIVGRETLRGRRLIR